MDACDYFSSMSSLAGRISCDIELTKQTYQELWFGLNQIERDQVINENIIDPALVLKYNSNHASAGRIKPNSKFSWFTKSQLDLYSESLKEIEKAEPFTTRKKGPAPEPPIRKDTTVLNQQPRRSSVGLEQSGHDRKGTQEWNGKDRNSMQEQNRQEWSRNDRSGHDRNPQEQNGHDRNSMQEVPVAPTQPLRVIVPSPVVAMKKRALIASPPSEPNNLFGRLKNRQKTEDRQPLVQSEPKPICKQPESKPNTKQPETLHPSGNPNHPRLSKPKTPPPPPPHVTMTTESVSLLSHDEIDLIPKTGFDFLDNW